MVLLTITIVVLLYAEPGGCEENAEAEAKKAKVRKHGKAVMAGKRTTSRKFMKGKKMKGEKGQKKTTGKTVKPKQSKELQCYSGAKAQTVQKCMKDALCYKQVTTSGEVVSCLRIL